MGALSGNRRFCDRSSSRRCSRRLINIDRRRSRRRRQQSCHRGLFLGRLLVTSGSGLTHGRCRRHEIADLLVLGQLQLIIADPADRILRCLHVLVRDDDQLDFTLVLERAQPFALFIEEVGGHIDRHLRNDARGSVLAQLLTNQPQNGQRHRFDAADTADPDAPGTNNVAGLTQRRPQPLP